MKSLDRNLFARTLIVADGPSNAGKGTQFKMLLEAMPTLGLVYLSSGEYFRSRTETACVVEGGALFPDDDYIPVISRGVDEQIRVASQRHPGFIFDGGVRKQFQASAVKRMFSVRGYERFILIRFNFDDWNEWDNRRKIRYAAEQRPDDDFGAASVKLVSYLINERVVLKACEDSGYEVYHINAGGAISEVAIELTALLTNL